MVQYSIPPANAAASVSDEYHNKNMRSMNIITDQVPVEMNSGRAIANTSRPPQGRDHQLLEFRDMPILGGTKTKEFRRSIPETPAIVQGP